MAPKKHQKRTDGGSWQNDIGDYHSGAIRRLFNAGSAYAHGRYMIEMSFKHPIMYILWFRWWIPYLLHKDERKMLREAIEFSRKYEYRPYWAEFALHHPVLFLVYLLFQTFIKFLSTPIKIIGGVFKCTTIKENADNPLIKNKFTQ